jgi:hypothetical protein
MTFFVVEIEKLTAACGVPFPEVPECLVPKKCRQAGAKGGTPKEGAESSKEDNVSVPKEGLEPSRPFGRRILSPLRLPFRHFGLS